MSAFDKIIGYASIRGELEKLVDILVSPEKYARLGVTVPAGLLFTGAPGVGKTTMASAFIEATGRRVFLCRKKLPDGEFVNEISRLFAEAADNAPSVVFLDDMDKFANAGPHNRDCEEYVAVQACLDELRGKDVFVVATVNDEDKLPSSLLRPGRFDKCITVEPPRGRDAELVIGHYLSQKRISPEVDAVLISRILRRATCAELESVVNEAGITAAFAGRAEIGMDDLIDACLRVRYGVSEPEENDEAFTRTVACHEAGHAVLEEVLRPGSVNLISVCDCPDGVKGLACVTREEPGVPRKDKREHDILALLGGRAASEVLLGEIDMGCGSDLDRALRMTSDLLNETCAYGFHTATGFHASEAMRTRQEERAQIEVERYYRQAVNLLVKHRPFLSALAETLARRGTLLGPEVRAIRESAEAAAA